MSSAIVIAAWTIGGIIAIFIFLLECRLHGYEASEVYNFDGDYLTILMMIIVLSPLVLTIEILFILYEIIKKYMIALIEVIVACKEIKEKKYEEENN